MSWVFWPEVESLPDVCEENQESMSGHRVVIDEAKRLFDGKSLDAVLMCIGGTNYEVYAVRDGREVYGKETIASIAHAKDVKLSWVKPGVLKVEADADLLLASRVPRCRVISESETSVTFDLSRLGALFPLNVLWLLAELFLPQKR